MILDSLAVTGTEVGLALRSLFGYGTEHVFYLGAMLLLAQTAWRWRRDGRLQLMERGRELRLREELEAYMQMDLSAGPEEAGHVDAAGAAKTVAMRVCRTVAEKSSFTRVMVLLRDAEGRLRCAGSIGVDDLTVGALERWGDQVVAEERGGIGAAGGAAGMRTGISLMGKNGAKNIQIPLGEWREFDEEVASWKMSGMPERRQWRRAIGMPLRMGDAGGRVAGVIVVCTDGLSVPIRDARGRLRLDRLIGPLELLARRWGKTLDAEELRERLLRAEIMAEFGQLTRGGRHARAAEETVVH